MLETAFFKMHNLPLFHAWLQVMKKHPNKFCNSAKNADFEDRSLNQTQMIRAPDFFEQLIFQTPVSSNWELGAIAPLDF